MRLLAFSVLASIFALAVGESAYAAPATPEPVSAAEAEPEADASCSKKQKFLDEKHVRGRVHARHPVAVIATEPLSVCNVWTHEVLPLDPKAPPAPAAVNELLRDHFTNQATSMDPRLASVILRAAANFKAMLIEVVSGYRAPKYNLMLRKKGHAVARESQHPLGHAVDFRLVGVSPRELYRFVRSLRVGGVGFYPHSGFVHADVGPIRTWKGQ